MKLKVQHFFPWNAGVLPGVSLWNFQHLCKINSKRTATVVYTHNVMYLHIYLCYLQLALFSATLYTSGSALLRKQLSISASHQSESYSLKWQILSEYWSTVLTQVLVIYHCLFKVQQIHIRHLNLQEINDFSYLASNGFQKQTQKLPTMYPQDKGGHEV